jgi:predicted nucleic-acid-binding Zn-ribbon protein
MRAFTSEEKQEIWSWCDNEKYTCFECKCATFEVAQWDDDLINKDNKEHLVLKCSSCGYIEAYLDE